MFCSMLLSCFFGLTTGYLDGAKWKLAFNIHGSDGHHFGFNAKAWEDDSNVGTDSKAFTADYKSHKVTIETANFIAIVRHQNGVCEAAKVWQFLKAGKTLHNYLDKSQTYRSKVTANNHTYSFISQTMAEKAKDPIFAADGGLVFNWVWFNNQVRIGNSGTAFEGKLPAKDAGDRDYLFQGLGNSLGGDYYWGFDTSVILGKSKCHGKTCKVQGKDHGAYLSDGKLYGQYAIYVSDEAKSFRCKKVNLKVTMHELHSLEIKDQFQRIDESQSGFLTYDEVVFAANDKNNDGLISTSEYSEARAAKDFGETASDADVSSDFKRIDKDGDGFLKFREVAFDIADVDKNGILSLQEFYRAREDNTLSESL